jgi:ATP-dependent DNA ligase
MSSKRSYSNFLDSEEFPFTIDNNYKIRFPKLFSKLNNSNKIRFWEIYAFLLNKKEKINLTSELTNLETFNELKLIYPKATMYIYTEYGQVNGKVTITEPTIIIEGKNLGKSNETSILTQSLIHMRNLYLKKIKSGYSLKIANITTDNIFPMALQVYDKHKKHIKYPCYIQPKLDGIRLISKIENSEVKLMSRRLNEFIGFNFIKEEIKLLLENDPDILLDGELYNHELSLQQISGIVRSEDENYEDKLKLKFYIFDCVDLQHHSLTFSERYEKLKELFHHKTFNYLILTETIKIHNEKSSDEYYKDYIEDGFEGIVYKNLDAKYEYSNYKEIRSYQFLKRKKGYDAEYSIIGYERGIHGKDTDAIIFIMKTESGKAFKAVPNDTLKNRKKMYKQALENFDSTFKNKLATIKFDEYSNDNVPLRAKFISIRDYE